MASNVRRPIGDTPGHDIQQPSSCKSSAVSKLVIPSGFEELDNFLSYGGLTLGSITEIVGEPNIGKTSLALQFCVTAQKPKFLGGPEVGAIYLGTRCKLDRLMEIAESHEIEWNKTKRERGSHEPDVCKYDISDGIIQFNCPSLQLVNERLVDVRNVLSSNKNIKLVVIDGIGGHMDSFSDNNKPIPEKVALISNNLNDILAKKEIALIVTNTKNVEKLYDPNYMAPFFSGVYGFWYPPCQMIQMRYDLNFHDSKLLRIVRNAQTAEGFVNYDISGLGISELW